MISHDFLDTLDDLRKNVLNKSLTIRSNIKEFLKKLHFYNQNVVVCVLLEIVPYYAFHYIKYTLERTTCVYNKFILYYVN